MANVHPEQEFARSREVFRDPATYAPFDLTTDFHRIVGCIDPRDEAVDCLKVIVQTPGGAIGKGLDAGLALTAHYEDDYSLEDGLRSDQRLQRSTSAGGHEACRFTLGRMSVLDEMIDPSDFTQTTYDRFVHQYELDVDSLGPNAKRVQEAGKRTRELIGLAEEAQLLAIVNELHPAHRNVAQMEGENRAGFYIFNHHPYVGLNRARVHRDQQPLTVQAYHDSLRASMDSLSGAVGMPADVKALRLPALLLRSAATRTVLCQGAEQMEFLHVVPTPYSLQVEVEYA